MLSEVAEHNKSQYKGEEELPRSPGCFFGTMHIPRKITPTYTKSGTLSTTQEEFNKRLREDFADSQKALTF